MMKILVTGARGFLGKNLIATLSRMQGIDIMQYDINSDPSLLNVYTKDCNFVFHLAGVNRPQNVEEFMKGNFEFTSQVLDMLKNNNNTCPVLITSSIQAILENPYGLSKKAGEDLILLYGKETGAKVLIYRLPNVFGKWCKPNYNSAIATFCHNISRNLPITVSDPDLEMNLVYIDDVIEELIRAMNGKETIHGDLCIVPVTYSIRLGEIVSLIYSLKNSREEFSIPNMSDDFIKKLYATYLSYLPDDGFSYPLKMNVDNRGSFTEIIRTEDRGQVSVNITKSGITKGNHWHHSKTEKFLVACGIGIIRFRKIGDDKIIEYCVNGNKLEVVDIPSGYTHNIENIGDSDMITIMWASEPFIADKPDTYFEEV